jgi:GNAT superfamily N-acetyltransferase
MDVHMENARGEQVPALTSRALGADADDVRRLRDCFVQNSERQRSQASFEWLYLRNPSGRLFVNVAATPDERVVAVYASLPSWVRCGGRRLLALQSLDTLTDREYRGRGLFVTLARSLYERAGVAGCGFVYGFPNGNSVHGFFNKLDWSSLDPVPFLIRPLRLQYGVSRLEKLRPWASWIPNVPLALPWVPSPPGTRVTSLSRFDERASELWSHFHEGRIGVAVERDAAYLNWRLCDKPDEQYQTLAVEQKDGSLAALCTFAVKDKHGGRIAYIMELLHRPAATLAASLLLARCVAEAARQGADAILAWCLPHSPNIGSYRLNGFITLPRPMRSIELHFGARAFEPSAALVGDRASWYVSYLDSDTV